MRKNFLRALVIGCCSLAFSCGDKGDTGQIRTITMTRVVHIPAHFWDGDTSQAALLQQPGRLAMTAGGEDELPQGPKSFDVLHDGSFVITDPLLQRLVFYDSLGNFLDHWRIGFPANSVALMEGGELEVSHAVTGDYYLVDDTRQPRLITTAGRGRREAAAQGAATLQRGANRGRISGPVARGGASGVLEVSFDSDSTQMISLESLGTDSRGFTFVAIEAAGADTVIHVNKIIRKYAADQTLVAEIPDIVIDYYAPPDDEFRVRDGCVYQLVPLQQEVQIRIWNTN